MDGDSRPVLAMKIILGLATFNRRSIWERGLLLDSLRRQTLKPDQLLIVDDSSTDGTLDVLPAMVRDLPFPVKIFKCTAPKVATRQASALPDNILFLHALRNDPGALFVHLDDDGWIVDPYLETAVRLQMQSPTCWFSHITFVDPVSFKVTSQDSRTTSCKPGQEFVAVARNQAWGAAWACPLSMIEATGGHDLSTAHMMGGDSRFGMSLRMQKPCYFTNNPAFVYMHLGESFYHTVRKDRKMLEFNRLSPGFGYTERASVNGGASFWTSGVLEKLHELVYDSRSAPVSPQAAAIAAHLSRGETQRPTA
jgi:glycosyltransferase involved in cell wall biosynthesis